MDECDCGFVRRLPVLPAHHGLRAEDWTGLALPVCSADCSKHYEVSCTHTHENNAFPNPIVHKPLTHQSRHLTTSLPKLLSLFPLAYESGHS